MSLSAKSPLRPAGATRWLELDALRAVAALGVLAFHWTTYFDVRYGHDASMPLRVPGGAYGVNLFFVISGFVITLTIRRAPRVRDFARSRFFRLFPTFWICLLLSAGAIAVAGPPDRAVSLLDLALNLTMIPKWLGAQPVDGVYWTLAIELAFYVWMAVFKVTGALETPRGRLAVALAWTVGSVVSGLFVRLTFHVVGTAFELQHPALATVCDVFVLRFAGLFATGMVLFDHVTSDRPRWSRLDVATLIACAVSQALWRGKGGAIAWLVSGTMVWAACRLRPSFLAVRPLVWLGAVSYPIYLLHQNIGFSILWNGYRRGLPSLLSLVLALALVLSLCALVHAVIERRAIALGKGKGKGQGKGTGGPKSVLDRPLSV